MTKKEFPGEPLESQLAAFVNVVVFEGVAVYRCLGTEGQVKETTDTLTLLYPLANMTTMGDAQWIGKARAGPERGDIVDVYELIVMRKVTDGEPATYT